jgi:hypothetical protein
MIFYLNVGTKIARDPFSLTVQNGKKKGYIADNYLAAYLKTIIATKIMRESGASEKQNFRCDVTNGNTVYSTFIAGYDLIFQYTINC